MMELSWSQSFEPMGVSATGTRLRRVGAGDLAGTCTSSCLENARIRASPGLIQGFALWTFGSALLFWWRADRMCEIWNDVGLSWLEYCRSVVKTRHSPRHATGAAGLVAFGRDLCWIERA